VDYLGNSSEGLQGGMNGSVAIFNQNLPNAKNSLDAGLVVFAWTACVTQFGGMTGLVNATVWTEIEGQWVGAAYMDLYQSQTTAVYGMGGHAGPTVVVALDYMYSGVMIQASICTLESGCNPISIELFSVIGCSQLN
jgi:hypothetical protein